MATDRIRLTLSAESGLSVTLAFPRVDLTAALFDLATYEELYENSSETAGRAALKILLGAGGLNLSGIAELFTLNAWGDQLAESDVQRWNRCAALVDAAFGPGALDGAGLAEACGQREEILERIRDIVAAEAADRAMREAEDGEDPLTAEDYTAAFGVALLEREVQAAEGGPEPDTSEYFAQQADQGPATEAPGDGWPGDGDGPETLREGE